MGNRFGRNQKRRMREQIAAAQAKADEADVALLDKERKLWAAERRAGDAETRAFNAFLADAGRYEYLCSRLVDMAARELGEKLRPQVEAIMRAARQSAPILYADVALRLDQQEPIRIVRIEVPRIQVNHADYVLGRL